MCAELASYGIPETLHHDDLGPGNVLDRTNGQFVSFDWGDSAVTHPFCSAFIPLRVARLVYDAPLQVLERLRDAYLARWLEFGPLEHLRTAFSLAHRLGALQRALTWYEGVPQLDPASRWEFADAPGYFLLHFFDGRE
jgi:aminoglycoside phosphotransferase (APT) family kinase protein